ncbi:hypothetical protein [Corallococcus exiguus]|uniref:hypothetical protein n=1 Tax=Corallococcus exiguus TaxID=83462 RepID=UPI001560A4F9|nr:hypothetical protein [Corallococcus exiguus]NRD43292.1 hypothetical protein [Corallococcus exiguus]
MRSDIQRQHVASKMTRTQPITECSLKAFPISYVLLASAVITSAACSKKSEPAPAPEAKAASPVAGGTATQAVAKPSTPGELPVIRYGEKTFPLRGALIWEEQLGGSSVLQFSMYDREVPCDERITTNAQRFAAGIMSVEAAEEGEKELRATEYKSPNRMFSGLPDFNASAEPYESYPPPYWGKLTVTQVTDTSITGTLRFASQQFLLEGPFTAKRCEGNAPR